MDFYKANNEPLVCITPIVNGKITIDGISNLYNNPENVEKIIFKSSPDYLMKYIKGDQFDVIKSTGLERPLYPTKKNLNG